MGFHFSFSSTSRCFALHLCRLHCCLVFFAASIVALSPVALSPPRSFHESLRSHSLESFIRFSFEHEKYISFS